MKGSKKLIAEVERLAQTLADAQADAVRLEAEAATAALRYDELAATDAAELLGEVTADAAAKKRIEVQAAIAQKQNAAARARALLVPLARRIVEAAIEAADRIIAEARPAYDRAVEARDIAAAELAKADLRVEAESCVLDEAIEEAERVRVRFDADARRRHKELERVADERITWFLRNGTEAALRQLPPALHDRARAAWTERVAKQRERFKDVRDPEPGEIFTGETYPQIEAQL